MSRISHSFEEKFRKQSQQLSLRLYSCIKSAIVHNDLPEGGSLPSSRELAAELAVSRSTVLKAYDLLKLEGYIESRPGSGLWVRHRDTEKAPVRPLATPAYGYPQISKTGKSFLENVPLINSTSDKSIAFRPGLPPLDIFPVNQWKNLSNLYWRYVKASALSYSPSSGIESLKKNLAHYLNITRGIKCDFRQVIIVSGSLQSLFLTGSVLLDAGDRVVMENPTFPNVHSIFKSLRAQISPIEVDEQGLRVRMLPAPGPGRVKLIHTTPSNHYPKGIRMSLDRRKELLDWANRDQCLIIENDYEHEIGNWNDSLPSLFSLDTQERVIYMGTFNRLLHPSIRLGYMVVPFYLLEAVEALQKHSHRFVPPSTQMVMNQFIEKKYLINHVQHVVEAAAERKEVFLSTFREHFHESISIVNEEAAGLYLLAKIHREADDREITALLESHNLIAHAYSKCFVTEDFEQGLILGYSCVRKPEIRKKLQVMAQLYNRSK